MIDSNVLIAKADASLSQWSTASVLKPELRDEFVVLMVTPDSALSLYQYKTIPGESYRIPRLRFGSAILVRGTSGQAIPAANRSRPDLSSGTASPKLLRGEVIIPDEIVTMNPDGDGIIKKLVSAASDAVRRDIGNCVHNGDDSATFSAQPLLSAFDGIIVEATSNVNTETSTTALTKDVLNRAELAGEAGYSEDLDLVHMTNRVAFRTFAESMADRLTPLGDKAMQEQGVLYHNGRRLMSNPIFPNNLGAGTNETAVISQNPKNQYVVFHEQIRLETQRDASSGAAKMVITVLVDQAREADEACVKTVGVLGQ